MEQWKKHQCWLQPVNVLQGMSIRFQFSHQCVYFRFDRLLIVFIHRKSASCTHVSALMHALVAMTQSEFKLQQVVPMSRAEDEEEALPITSYPCQWKPPKKRKESNMQMSEAVFQKHDYSSLKKRKVRLVEDFDPRPECYKGTAGNNFPALLDTVRGQAICISLLFDPQSCHWTNDNPMPSTAIPHQPSISSLKATITAFKDSLQIPDDKIRKIEIDTREQRYSSLWFSVRRYRLTASLFGEVLRRRDDTPPQSLVLRILQQKQFSSAAIEWGIQNEPIAIQKYIDHQHTHGHPLLMVSPSGFFVSSTHPFLGASPDGAVYDPSNSQQPFGFIEVKCPYSARDDTPVDACALSGFCCTLECTPGGNQQLKLKENHNYFAQIQGQMAIGDRPWCDFVIYTKKGISIQRITFNQDYWERTLLPRLTSFYDNCVAPEIVSPVVSLFVICQNYNLNCHCIPSEILSSIHITNIN